MQPYVAYDLVVTPGATIAFPGVFADSALNVGISSGAAGTIDLFLNIAILILHIVALWEPIHRKIKKLSDLAGHRSPSRELGSLQDSKLLHKPTGDK
jgi:hypothetical protein